MPRLRLGEDDVRLELRGVRCGLPVNRPELRNLESSLPPVFA